MPLQPLPLPPPPLLLLLLGPTEQEPCADPARASSPHLAAKAAGSAAKTSARPPTFDHCAEEEAGDTSTLTLQSACALRRRRRACQEKGRANSLAPPRLKKILRSVVAHLVPYIQQTERVGWTFVYGRLCCRGGIILPSGMCSNVSQRLRPGLPVPGKLLP